MIKKVNNKIESLLSLFCMLCIVLLTVIVAIQVITRWMGLSLPWTEELARFFLVWLTFSGSSLAIKKNLHLSVKFFVKLVPATMRVVIGSITYIVMVVFFGVITFYGFKLTILSFDTLSSSLQWPLGLIYIVLPITSIISIYFTIAEFSEFFRNRGVQI